MKRSILTLLLMAFVLLLAGCSAQDGGDGGTVPSAAQASGDSAKGAEEIAVDVDITEKMFVAQINDIYLNPQNYLGKTIRLEGMFKSTANLSTGSSYRFVYRNGPGCCGTDTMPGFEVTGDGNYPEDNAWVRATGVLEEYEEDGQPYFQLRLKELEVLDKRGQETVAQ
ncbi:hypothetical protein [Eubacterium sp. 1001713B170207_170306_E7]|uniref:TIGR03943 family putative permease subunit n=1 Tax=Eubacterium sp. 1001713B170207_170306_E7 TaxID=2787097 RepID=UPI0018971EBF|nr:hypothetical protein [Eubacterium sp. 1001713B170207_170306_E7]